MSRKLGILIVVLLAFIFIIFFLALETNKFSSADVENLKQKSSVQKIASAWKKQNYPLPKVDISSLSASQVLLKPEFNNQCFLINVWASWCRECLAEFDLLLELKQKKIAILGLNYKDDLKKAQFLLEEKSNPFLQTIYEPEGVLALAFDLGVKGAPETFLLDKNQIIRLRKLGALTREDLSFLLDQIEACNKNNFNS